MTPNAEAAYYAAIAADDNYQAELVRVYGSRAGDMRYQSSKHDDPALIKAREAKLKADEVWRAAHQGYEMATVRAIKEKP